MIKTAYGEVNDNHIKRMRALFVMSRRQYLEERLSYREDKSKSKHMKAVRRPKNLQEKRDYPTGWVPRFLTDDVIYNHFTGKQFFGVYADKETRFILFDVDTKENAINDVQKLRRVLIENFEIPDEYINIAFSGSKGFHLFITFNYSVDVLKIQDFYNDVLEIGDFNSNDIELRPGKYNSYAVKCIFALHPETQKRAWLVNKDTFECIESFDTIFDIKQMDCSYFRHYKAETKTGDKYTPTQDTHTQMARIQEYRIKIDKKETKPITNKDKNNKVEQVKKVLESEQLLYPSTRDDVAFWGSIYLRSLNYSSEETIAILNNIYTNTLKKNPSFIDMEPEYIADETARVVNNTYELGYRLFKSTQSKNMKWSKGEIDEILSVKEYHLKRLYYMLLKHAKIHGREFYMTTRQMADSGANTDRTGLKKDIHKLQELGKIEIVRYGEFDKQLQYYKPNMYRIPKRDKKNNPDTDNIEITTDINFEKWLFTLQDNSVIKLKDYISYPKRKKIIDMYKS